MEKEIKNLLYGIAKEFNGGGAVSDWTREVKQGLVKLGQKQGYGTAASGVIGADYHEWLCDLIWWDHEDGNLNNMKSIELAVESEWSRDLAELENDFLKLVYLKARLKLFIFATTSEEGYKAKLERLKKLANMCEDKDNDKYLFFYTVAEEGEQFQYEEHTTTP